MYPFICFSQIKKGEIDYKLTTIIQQTGNLNQPMMEMLQKSNKKAEKINYTVNFIGNESYFFANEILEEDNMFNAYVVIGGGKLKLYENKETGECREFIDNRRVGQVIINRKIPFQWTLYKETKLIDGYKCFKATSPYFKEDGTINENSNLIITAWYCPEIAVNIGPIGYGNLPGLILELQTKTSIFTATKINLNPEKNLLIDRLNKTKAISEEQYKEMIMGTFNKAQLEAIEESKNKK